MRILIDMQVAQDEIAVEGANCSAVEFAKNLVICKGVHDIFLLIDRSFRDTAEILEEIFHPILPEGCLLSWYPPAGIDVKDILFKKKTGILYAETILKARPDILVNYGLVRQDGRMPDGYYGLSRLVNKLCRCIIINEQLNENGSSRNILSDAESGYDSWLNYTDAFLYDENRKVSEFSADGVVAINWHKNQEIIVVLEKFFSEWNDKDKLSTSVLESDIFSICREIAHPGLSIEQKKAFAVAIVRNLQLEPAKLLVDITNLHIFDNGTGIQRVVRSTVDCLMKQLPENYKVCPVYFKNDQIFEANRWCERRYPHQVQYHGKDDFIVRPSGKDIFLGLDLATAYLNSYEKYLMNAKFAGTKVYTFVYDLLPVTFPDYFPEGTFEKHNEWLEIISRFDGIIADSRSVAREFYIWREKNAGGKDGDGFVYAWSHLGNDIKNYLGGKGISPESENILAIMGKKTSILMVSTIEPRKGYRQSLSAFEKLWAEGIDVNLVIVGRPGWKMDDFIEKLKNHQENGNHLYWLSEISDNILNAIYEKAAGVLMASEGEGFGLSIVEAAGHGKPLLLRDIPVFREIAGDNASYFAGMDPELLAQALKNWLWLIKSGTVPSSKNIKILTWQEFTNGILDILHIKKGKDR